MLHALRFPSTLPAAQLFAGLDEHLVLASIFAGNSPAAIYVDDPYVPGAGFTWFKHRAFLGGSPDNRGFLADLGEHLNEDLIPNALASGIDAFLLHFNDPAWQPELANLLPVYTPILAQRQYYRMDIDSPAEPPRFDREPLPDGFEALPVDASLLARDELANIELLRNETCSERLSVEDFFVFQFWELPGQSGEAGGLVPV